jgi:hypothetical protein
MTKAEAHDIVKRVVEAFSTGDCRNLPSMKEIEEAAAILAKTAGANKPEMERDSKGLAILTKKLADYLKELAAKATAEECRNVIVDQIPELDDKLPGQKRKM